MVPAAVDVLIVGAGPTGLVLACELARRKVSFRLVDEISGAATISKAAGVQARSMEMWDSMGLAETVARESRIIRGINIFSGTKRVVHVPVEGLDSPYPHIYGISQRDIEGLLREHLAKLGGRAEWSTGLESFTQDDEGVTSTLVGSNGTTEEFRTRWIVGCDGAHSRVRKVLGFSFEGAPYEERIIQSDLRVSLPLAGVEDEIVDIMGEGTMLAFFPLFKDGRHRMVVLGGPEAEIEQPTLEDFQRVLDARLPGARASDPAWAVNFRIHHRHVERYQDRRAFIAGDACHIHSPVGGQGMNAGMQDAYNLAWKLALVARGRAKPELLDSYGPERLPIAHSLVSKTDMAMQTVENAIRFQNPVTVGTRNALMSFVSKLSFVQKKTTGTLSMLEHNYRGGPLGAQDRGALWEGGGLGDWAAFGDGPAPGDRVPDAPLRHADGAPDSVHHLLRAGTFQLLMFAGPADSSPTHLADVARRVEARVAGEVACYVVFAGSTTEASTNPAVPLFDADGALHKRFGARSECLYLLRPDGYVAYRSHPADGDKLLAYLDRLFVKV